MVHKSLVYHRIMGVYTQVIISAADGAASGVSPVLFVVGGVALIVVSTLGPLSRLHERRSAEKRAAPADPASPRE